MCNKCLWKKRSVYFTESRTEIWKQSQKNMARFRCVWKVWSGVDQSQAVCWSRQREDDTRFILESWEDKEGSRQWRKDRERHVRTVCVYVCVYSKICIYGIVRSVFPACMECRYVLLNLCLVTLTMLSEQNSNRWQKERGASGIQTNCRLWKNSAGLVTDQSHGTYVLHVYTPDGD